MSLLERWVSDLERDAPFSREDAPEPRPRTSGAVARSGDELLEAPGGKWVDVEAPTEEELWKLAPRFGLHRLEIEDCMHLGQRPKVEEYPGHVFIVLQGFTCDTGDPTQLDLQELHLMVADDWLLTVHEHHLKTVEGVRARMTADPQQSWPRGFDFIAYLLADALVDAAFPVLDLLNDALDELETQIFEAPKREHLERIWTLKRPLMQMRRVLSPQRDAVGLLSRRGIPHIQDRTTLYFRDVYDHLIRVYEQLESARDLLSNDMEAWLGVTANRTGEVSKQLTVIATIFLPLTFITGFFGQNFEALQTPRFYWLMLASMVLLPTGFLLWFRKKEWM